MINTNFQLAAAMYETGRRAHLSEALRVRYLDWNTYIPDEREGVESPEKPSVRDAFEQKPWFQATSRLGYQRPSVVLVEEVVVRDDVGPPTEANAAATGQKLGQVNNDKGGQRQRQRSTKGAKYQKGRTEATGAMAIMQGAKKADRTLSAIAVNQKTNIDGKSDSAARSKKQDVKMVDKAVNFNEGVQMVQKGVNTTKQGVRVGREVTHCTKADEKGAIRINQGLQQDGKGGLPPTAKSTAVVRRMELDSGNNYTHISNNDQMVHNY